MKHLLGLAALVLTSLLLALTSSQAALAAPAVQQEDEPIRVVTKEVSPFVISDNGRLTGFSVDLWKEIALITGTNFEVVELESVSDLLDALVEGEADVAIAAISMTPEREEIIDFSYPYFRAGLQIMTVSRPASRFVGLIGALLSPTFLAILGSLIVVMFIVGHVVWLLERNSNPNFSQRYWPGVWDGLWWSAVTMTTVGYGDKIVKGVAGRILGLFWMFSGIFLIANFTAVVTSELTVNQLANSIETVEDLRGKRVATLTGSTSADYLGKRRIAFRSLDTIDHAYALLEEGEIDAILYDAPVLQYYAATNAQAGVRVVGSPFNLENYGIALPSNSPHEEEINRALLHLIQTGAYQEIRDRWSISDAPE